MNTTLSQGLEEVKKTEVLLFVDRACKTEHTLPVCSVTSVMSNSLWNITHQAPLSMEFSRQEYWSGLPGPSSGDLPNPGFELRSPELQADSLLSEPPGKTLT